MPTIVGFLKFITRTNDFVCHSEQIYNQTCLTFDIYLKNRIKGQSVLRLKKTVWYGLLYVIVVFLDHTHFLFNM